MTFICDEVGWDVQVVRRDHQGLSVRGEDRRAFVLTDVARQGEHTFHGFFHDEIDRLFHLKLEEPLAALSS